MNLDGAKFAISGVGGFIGARIARRALARGLAVRGLDVSEASLARVRSEGVAPLVGTIQDAEAARALVAGADVVVHTAATVAAGGDLASFRAINVEGTRTVLQAARDAGVKCFVHLSSVMVYGFDFPANVAEEGPFRGEGSPYCITKIESDDLARSFDAPTGMRVIVLRPGDVYGPESRAWILGPLEFLRRKQLVLPRSGKGIVNHVHVENLVDAVFLALERGAYGQAFNVTDGQATHCADFYGRLAAAADLGTVPTAPSFALFAGLRLAETLGRLKKGEAPALVETLRFLGRPHTYSIAKARAELGYAPRVTLDEGFEEIRRSLRANPKASEARAVPA